MNESQKIIGRLSKEGWVEVPRKGSHATFKKDGVPHLITVPHPERTYLPG